MPLFAFERSLYKKMLFANIHICSCPVLYTKS